MTSTPTSTWTDYTSLPLCFSLFTSMFASGGKGGKKKALKRAKELSLRRYGICLCLPAMNEASTVNVRVEVGVPPAARHA